jgi:hypothetical protein
LNLTEEPTEDQKNAAADSVIARCAVEGVEFIASWEMKDQAPEWWKLRARLGIGSPQARFFPYWRPGCPAKTSTEKALVSAYAFDGQRAVLAIANTLPKETPVDVSVDLTALGWPSGSEPVLTDERTGASIPWNNGQFTVPVKSRNYTLVSLQPAPSNP